jgi:hypothetical protein
MAQEIFKTKYVEELRRKVKDNSIVKYYESDIFEYDESQVLISPTINKPENNTLNLPDNKSFYDFENSLKLFEQYKHLTPLQASDVRLWTYLAHVDNFKYMSIRWPGIKNNTAKDPAKYILDHWFIASANQSAFLRHGIAGLWWAAFLTYDEKREDPYELTKVLYTQLDFATRTLGTYGLSRHRDAIMGILEFIVENPSIFKNKFEDKSRFITKYINQLGGIKPITFFDKNYFKNNLELIKQTIEQI